jgi:propanol-preferring alcohol dehydrogenase
VLLRVLGAGICHSDLNIAAVGMEVFPLPMTLGHETAGRVETVGGDVEGWSVGDAGLVYLVWSCGSCRSCLAGRENLCAGAGRHAPPTTPGIGPDGGMAEFMVVPARFLVPLGELDPVRAAPLADAGLTPQHAIDSAREQLADGCTAVVIGAGGLGNIAIQLLQATSTARLIVVESDAARRALAAERGVEVLSPGPDLARKIRERTDGLGADAVFDFVGVDETLALAVDSVAPGGAIRIVGIGGGSLHYTATGLPHPLPYGVTLRQQFGGTRADLEEVVRLARLGKVVPQIETFPLEGFETAFDRLRAGTLLGRAVLVP